MGLLTQAELDPLQAARRVAEEHIEAIREIAMARLKALPARYGSENAAVLAENNRYHKIDEVISALQTIYDAVSELEFEEEQPEEPAEPEPPEEPEDEPEDDDEEEDDEDGDEDED